MVCAECGRVADDTARGWQGHREDLPEDEDPPAVALFCPACAAREFGGGEMNSRQSDHR